MLNNLEVIKPLLEFTKKGDFSVNGKHLITRRFDVMEFAKKYPDVDIQKKNPTLLYYPKSLL
jgi:hypothetical protein